MKYTVFEVAGGSFGIGIEGVVEILKYREIERIPQLPDFISGVINVRGDVIPVIDLRERFGITEEADRRRIITVRLGGGTAGLIVDEVTGIREIPDEKISSPPRVFNEFRPDFMKGLCHEQPGRDRVTIILDIERILNRDEKIMLKTSMEKLTGEGRKRGGRRVEKRPG